MSTKVNITVGNDALLDSSKQQQVVNRQGQLEKESRKELKDRALAANADLRAALGKDLNGQPIYGAQLGIPKIDRRPAANRNITDDYYVAELLNYTIYGTQEGDIKIDITTEDGSQYSFNLTSTFAYQSTDYLDDGFGTVYVTAEGGNVNYTGTYNPPEAETDPLLEYYIDIDQTSFPNAPSWGTSLLVTNTITQSTTVAPNPARGSLTLLFPLRKDSYILVAVGKSTRFRASTTVVSTAQHNYVPVSEPSDPDGTAYRHDFSFNWTSTIEEQEDNFQWSKCFYVDKSTCREINTPAGLYALLENYLEDYNVSISWLYDTSTNNRISRINGVETVGAFEDKLAPTSVFSTSISNPPNFSDKYRLYGFLATNNGQAVSTPGIYKAIQLSATDSRFINPDNTNLTEVSYMVNNFYGGSYSALPKFGLQSIFEFLPENAPKYWGHYRTKQRPIYNRNLVGPELSGLKNTTKVRTVGLNTLVWDWNRSDYCRQQLFALGFTSADLMP